jgi:altered-inheritance-of-mitochondria protein 13
VLLVLFLHLVFYQSSLQFSQDLVDTLADNAASPSPSPARQNSIDAQIRARIQAELEHLRAEEQAVRDQIHAALEKENLDRERAMAGDPGSVKTSPALLADLEEVRAKVDRFHARKDLSDYPALREDSDALVACYKCVPFPVVPHQFNFRHRNNTTTPLNCWQQVDKFKDSVAQIEQVRSFLVH